MCWYIIKILERRDLYHNTLVVNAGMYYCIYCILLYCFTQIMSKWISYRVKSIAIGSINSPSNQQLRRNFHTDSPFLLHSINIFFENVGYIFGKNIFITLTKIVYTYWDYSNCSRPCSVLGFDSLVGHSGVYERVNSRDSGRNTMGSYTITTDSTNTFPCIVT